MTKCESLYVLGYKSTVLKKNHIIQKDFVMSIPRDGFVFSNRKYTSHYTMSHCGRKTYHCSSVGHVKG